jgi:hypothetical protein
MTTHSPKAAAEAWKLFRRGLVEWRLHIYAFEDIMWIADFSHRSRSIYRV